jgi:hypothetical protein
MTDFTGSKFKLSGFNIQQKGSLVKVFAAFSGLNDNSPASQSYIEEIAVAELKERGPGHVISTGPKVSVDDIVELLVGKQDLAIREDHLRLPLPSKEDLLKDIGPEKLALLLVEMGKAKAAYLRGTNTFIPVEKLNKI